ncbi:hypothetical protein BCR41DRAFT_390834 [Lobosporangium transversale]|uniref:F-box domain-containing protein n=1 Tax=Lobosporangium transversale TaxID=64571 RepID=A0A1Y2G5D9_9FUNG|nr:hypothetical protein BCR41DRAFT_390834 [Lobosporangium transversale]ORY95121.1 hypothetical protein BCR41DRAFT_390834 [Lobosporangium transversale]|eukprot:XP_021875328.1 hypothetical protein BCR41DRAFT_390834 [Lobosporangium transversale]
MSLLGQDRSNAVAKVFSLPEICQRIAHVLDRSTIAACLRVSRACNAAWLPILWYTIDAGKHWHHPAFRNSLSKHSGLIRILKCSRYDDISLLFNTQSNKDTLCENLLTLVLPKTTLINQKDHVRLLLQNPQLRDLSLTFHDDPSSHYSALVDAVGELRFLRRLAFDENKTLQVSTLETILTQCNSSLQELSFKGTHAYKHPFGSGEEFASGLLPIASAPEQITDGIRNLSQDTEIEIKGSFGILSLCMDNVACTQDLLLNLGSRFPLLNRLSLRESVEVYFSQDFPERLARRCPKIKYLDISSTEDMDDDTIARLIASFPNLQTFRASDTRFGDRSLVALIENCRDLTVLDIGAAYGIQGHMVQLLFERCWSLRRLDAWNVSVNVADMIKEAYGGVKGPSAIASGRQHLDTSVSNHNSPITFRQWACHGIESLAMRFDYDACVLTEDEQRLFPPSKARIFVYEQLSKLSKLKYLAITGSLLDAEDQYESGYTNEGDEEDDTSFDVPEIMWMSKNWPSLVSIQGLHEEDDELVIEWLREHRPDISLDDEEID